MDDNKSESFNEKGIDRSPVKINDSKYIKYKKFIKEITIHF